MTFYTRWIYELIKSWSSSSFRSSFYLHFISFRLLFYFMCIFLYSLSIRSHFFCFLLLLLLYWTEEQKVCVFREFLIRTKNNAIDVDCRRFVCYIFFLPISSLSFNVTGDVDDKITMWFLIIYFCFVVILLSFSLRSHVELYASRHDGLIQFLLYSNFSDLSFFLFVVN